MAHECSREEVEIQRVEVGGLALLHELEVERGGRLRSRRGWHPTKAAEFMQGLSVFGLSIERRTTSERLETLFLQPL